MTAVQKSFFRWPPPGLEMIHARLMPLIVLLAIGDLVLVIPLLWAVTGDWSFWSLGPFGSSWWVLILTSVTGLVLLLAGFERLARLMWLGGQASRRGHRWMTILQVVVDTPRDTGFVLQGARLYAQLSAGERARIIAARVVGTLAYLAAALWLPFGFVVAILLAARGVLGANGIVLGTVLLPAGLFAIGFGGTLLDYLTRRKAMRDPATQAASEEEIRGEVDEWNRAARESGHDAGFGAGTNVAPRAFRLCIVGTIIIAVIVVVPTGTLSLTAAIGPILGSVAVPGIARARARIAAAKALSDFRLEPDTGVSEQAAGEALHTITSVGVALEENQVELAPARVYEESWFPETEDSTLESHNIDWVLDLLRRARGGLSSAERAYLSRVAAHPAHREWETTGRAARADILGTRYKLPLPDSLSPFALPIVRLTPLRNGAIAHMAIAALDLSRGRADQAEGRIREVLSTGFLLMNDAPMIIDNMIGTMLVHDGGRALAALFRITGRGVEGDGLERLQIATREVGNRATRTFSGFSLQEALRRAPDIVLDSTATPGIRWELFMTTTSFGPCTNLRSVVLGPGASYEEWLESAREVLVRRPSDEALFDFLRRGWFGSGDIAPQPGLLVRALLKIAFGGRESSELCGAYFTTF